MLTVFTIPKPFVGRAGEIQSNAVRSWVSLAPDVQVVLVGDEDGTATAARALEVEHLPGVLRNERGTPRLDSAFAQVEAVARQPLRCFVNADVVLLDDLPAAVERVTKAYDRFLIVGRTLELDGVTPVEIREPSRLRERAVAEGTPRGAAALDYFVFTPGLFGELPSFVIGRAGFDNWLVWQARQTGPVVDATAYVCAIHQAHDYGHLAGGEAEAYSGAEAGSNIALAGGRSRIYTLHDASHRLLADGEIRRNYGSILRARETARKVGWKLGHR